MKYLLFTLVIIGSLAANLQAGDCYIRPRATYTSYTPTLYSYNGHGYQRYESNYSHKSDQLYYYRDGYYYPYENVKEKILLVPKAIEVEVKPPYGRDHYYSIDPLLQQNLLADAIVGRLLRMKDAGTSPVTVLPSSPIPSSPAPAPTPIPTMPPLPADDPEYGTPRAGAFQDAKLLTIVTGSCAKCHGATASKYVKLVTPDGKLNDISQGKAWECFGLVNSGEMPKGAKSLEDEAVKLFYAWAKNARKK